MPNELSSINHIVHLMMENRSFDQMLGFLYADKNNVLPGGRLYNGLTGKESNPDGTGRQVPVFRITADMDHPYFMPGCDPGEGFLNTNLQLFSTQNPAPGAVPTNDGFVGDFKAAINYDLAHHYSDTLPNTDPNEIMGMYTPELLPIMSGLAKGFAVCDAWFASAPTQTIPNRAFANAGTSQGHLDNKVKVFTCPSIFGKLSDHDLNWAIFGYNRPALTRLDFPDTKDADESHFGNFNEFVDRATNGNLPEFTFLEPSFGSDGNSQHPNGDVALGEKLFYDVYYTLRNGPAWSQTLLIITYDECGGCYDHIAPPYGAVAPDDSVGEFGFDFTRFGVRVPALLISPLIAEGTVFRAAKGTIDHTSVLKTIEERWGLNPLTERDKAAPSLGDVLTLAIARTDDPLAPAGLPPILVPSSGQLHPNLSKPSKLDMVHADRVAALPIKNDQGTFDHTMPTLNTTGEVSDYIRSRTALWTHQKTSRHHAPASSVGILKP